MKPRFHALVVTFVLISPWVLAGSAIAAIAVIADHHPVVPAFDRFHGTASAASVEEQAAAGRLLMGELNCAGCHQTELPSIVSKRPPLLAEVGTRVKPDYLRKFIANPHATKSGTTMPDVLAALPANTREKTVESLVHYLISVGEGLPQPGYVSGSARARGEQLFHSVGCAACHGGRNEDAKPLAHAVPLGNPDEKYTIGSLAKFLQDPLHVRVSGRMPNFGLTARESEAIAAYLLPSVPAKPGIEYTYYEGSWTKLPDFDELKPVAAGTADSFDVEKVAVKDDHFGLRFAGVLAIEADGEYEFEVRSDDGSRLYIDDKLVVDNDNVHGEETVKSKVSLKRGRHAVTLDFFEQGGGVALFAWYSGPGVDRRELSEVLVSSEPTESLETIEFEVDRDLASAGKKSFRSLGCASCHEVGEPVVGPVPFSAAGLVKTSDLNAGCLADSAKAAQGSQGSSAPAKTVPWFGFNDVQRVAIRAAIQSSDRPLHPAGTIDSAIAHLNCVACHERDKRGGVVDEVNEYFTGTEPEMGDEGRKPPLLTGVGAKIKPEYLANLIAKGGKDRPYVNTRMPGFGEENTRHLSAAFSKHDKLENTLPTVTVDHKEAKKAARAMVGAKAFGCIKCHTFGRFKATGVQSIDMTKMTERLQEEWFRQYVRNPIAFRPGTRMPSAWPLTGPSMLPKFLDGDSDKQIQAVWNYLTDGARMRVPDGLGNDTMELIATSEAVLYRNFIKGAGSRAIGVGLPEGFNYAFDANELRMALIWQGAFIDAGRHWKGRGQGEQPPLGEKVVAQPEGVAFAILGDAQASWPQASARELDDYQFLGYSLGEGQRPTFRYRVGGYEIHDTPTAIDETEKVALRRRLEIKSAGTAPAAATLYYRAAEGVVEKQAGGYRVGDVAIAFELPDGSVPLVREADGKQQLLVPLKVGDVLTQDYVW